MAGKIFFKVFFFYYYYQDNQKSILYGCAFNIEEKKAYFTVEKSLKNTHGYFIE